VAIFVTNTAIGAMDDEFGLLIARDLSRRINGLSLGVMQGSRPLITGTLNSPSILVGNNMLIFTCHDKSPSVEPSALLDCML
jgi:hypothetical protein